MRAAPSLPELQRQFAAAMLDEEPSLLRAWVLGKGLTPEARLQVYRNIVRNNHAAALRTAYPVVLRLVGDDFFELVAARYMRDCPTRSGNLQDYGADFAEFLAQVPEASGLAYLPDVARLEWARQESYLAADMPTLSQAELHAALRDPESPALRFTLHPSIRLVNSIHPIWDIWMFCQKAAPEHLDLSSGRQTVIVWRDSNQLAMQLLVSGRRQFITALLTQAPLAAAYEQAIAAEANFDLTACLYELLGAGLVTGFFISR
ncbi:MAG: putative DNA-binding domain-containing protein [Gammaproteobacteria bacterium]|nr:putative DNA-binding domain-containing protein [Gammaproteobacteria bacterium]